MSRLGWSVGILRLTETRVDFKSRTLEYLGLGGFVQFTGPRAPEICLRSRDRHPFGDDRPGPLRQRDGAALKKPQQLDQRFFRAEVGGKSEGSSTPTKNDVLCSQSLPRVYVLEICVVPNLTPDDAQLDAVVEQIQPG